MSTDSKTLSVYDARVDDYADMVTRAATIPGLDAFLRELPAGSRVLDLGCGPGNSAAAMVAAGFDVDAVDAAPAMVAHANRTYGLNARHARFDEITGQNAYDGIWANFSLLHAPKSALPGHLALLKAALRAAGVFHIGVKLGKGEARDKIGRFYAYYSEEELEQMLINAGFKPFGRDHGTDKGLSGSRDPWIVIRAYG